MPYHHYLRMGLRREFHLLEMHGVSIVNGQFDHVAINGDR